MELISLVQFEEAQVLRCFVKFFLFFHIIKWLERNFIIKRRKYVFVKECVFVKWIFN